MALSNTWTNSEDVYKPKMVVRDLPKMIYRSNGFEAFVVSEDEDSYRIEGNGVKCSIWKSRSKSKIVRVSSDYKLRTKK